MKDFSKSTLSLALIVFLFVMATLLSSQFNRKAVDQLDTKLFGVNQVKINEAKKINSGFTGLAGLVDEKSLKYQGVELMPGAKVSIVSHHLPTASDLIIKNYAVLKESLTGEAPIFVVIGPDHFENCNSLISITDRDFDTPFGVLELDQSLKAQFQELARVDDCFVGEHSIGVQALMIKKFFPKARFVPILISSAVTQKEIDQVVTILKENQSQIFLITSVDFSHYQSKQVASEFDRQSRDFIEKMEWNSLSFDHVDSPASMEVALRFALSQELKPYILENLNSFEVNGLDGNTTSYFSVVFGK